MNVLGFMASPRKGGNSDMLLDSFLAGAQSVGAKVEKVYLYDCHIEYCDGCWLKCWTTDDSCPRWHDDVDRLHDKMLASDLVAFSSPLFMGNPPAKLIAFFERSIDLKKVNMETLVVEKNKLQGKKAVVLQVNFFNDIAYQKLPSMVYERILKEIFKMEIVGTYGVPGVADVGDIHRKPEALKEADDMGARICAGV
ncbi:MAG TPA: flavodoxin family protein [Thermodesulfobacteriota bacterium]|nr:flavodoxin family protein [Thermodesulfobacteriota bacterium]HOC39581.1 flavodoxin family protein [Thermodesulfobacteriota bacterium]HQO79203.1 flavodoxin family protein [Thermodesulfobacteriota bacterium]